MKRIVIFRDKTMLWLVLTSLALGVLNMSRVAQSAMARMYPMVAGIYCIGVLVLHIVMLHKLILVVRFKKDSLTSGLLGMQYAPYRQVKRVDCKETIKLHFGTKGKGMPIPVLDLEENEAKYREIMEEIKARCDVMVDVNRAMGNLRSADKRRYKSGDEVPKIKGWLKLLMAKIIGVVAAGGLGLMFSFLLVLLPINGEQATKLVPNLVGLGVLWPCAIITMVLALRKRRVAILWLRIYEWVTLAVLVGVNLYTAIIQPTEGLVGYVDIVRNIIAGVISAAIVLRYIKVSKRVERTFIYERYIKGNKRGKRSQQPMAKWKVLVLVLAAGLVLFVGYKGIRYYNSIDKNVYGSVSEIIETKYGGEDVQTLEAGDFCYVVVNGGGYPGPYWRRDDGKYICVNEWHEETQGARMVYHTIHPDKYLFLGFMKICNHDNKYSMMLDVNLFNHQNTVQVVDNDGVMEPQTIYENDYYFKVMDMDSVPEDYLLEIKVDGEVVYSATKEDIDYAARRAKRKAELMEKMSGSN